MRRAELPPPSVAASVTRSVSRPPSASRLRSAARRRSTSVFCRRARVRRTCARTVRRPARIRTAIRAGSLERIRSLTVRAPGRSGRARTPGRGAVRSTAGATGAGVAGRGATGWSAVSVGASGAPARNCTQRATDGRARAVEHEQHVPAGWRDVDEAGIRTLRPLPATRPSTDSSTWRWFMSTPWVTALGATRTARLRRPAGRLAHRDAYVVAPGGGRRAARDRRSRRALGAVEQVGRLVDLGLVERLARRRALADERIGLVVHVPVVVPGREHPPIREQRRDGVVGAPLPLRRPDRPVMAARLQQLDVLELLAAARVAVQRRRRAARVALAGGAARPRRASRRAAARR